MGRHSSHRPQLGLFLLAGLLLAACTSSGAPAAAPAASGAPDAAAAARVPSAPARVSMRTAYTTDTAAYAPLLLAADKGLFAAEGIDAEVVFIGAGQAVLGSLASGETPIVLA